MSDKKMSFSDFRNEKKICEYCTYTDGMIIGLAQINNNYSSYLKADDIHNAAKIHSSIFAITSTNVLLK